MPDQWEKENRQTAVRTHCEASRASRSFYPIDEPVVVRGNLPERLLPPHCADDKTDEPYADMPDAALSRISSPGDGDPHPTIRRKMTVVLTGLRRSKEKRVSIAGGFYCRS